MSRRAGPAPGPPWRAGHPADRTALPDLPGRLGVTALLLASLLLSGPVAEAAAQEPDSLPRVVILTTGGTIASSPGGTLAGDSVVAGVPGLGEHARVRVEEFSRIGSSSMTPDHWLRLAARVEELFASDPGPAGIVITHGTDTLEETAFFLDLTVSPRRPVVLTGAMRSADAVSADGPANLLAAVRVAVSPDAAGQGVLVVLDGEIHAARRVRKTHNLRVGTFESGDLGALGWADPDTVLFRRRARSVAGASPGAESPFRPGGLEALPRVALVADYTGSDGSLLDRAVESGPDGVVVATFAGGRASRGTRAAVARATAAGLPVVLASRVPGGRIAGDPGRALGAVVAPDLSPWKARILLMLALTRTEDAEGLREIFRRF